MGNVINLYSRVYDKIEILHPKGWHNEIIIEWMIDNRLSQSKLFWRIKGIDIEFYPLYLSDVYEKYGEDISQFFIDILEYIRVETINNNDNLQELDVNGLSEAEAESFERYTNAHNKLYSMIKVI